ncbi:hypothetical protein STRTUCAR8_06047 [Streptomyces turgidiscabies Car8]|uniref:Uncharacterized protein n=1 Tax=Streptomyces turgidiscabies (strain Car8) TaxID=698760 RepID=L7F2I6_STRT8|nr:hypothetical protein STRTUCAR8_06047 [Streptomyces turgidiscabies Car8]
MDFRRARPCPYTSLPGIFAADYAERLEAARSRLRPALDDSASDEECADA